MSLVLALQGAPRATIQAALAGFAARRAAEGWRVAGVIEVTNGPEGPGCAGQALQDLSSGRIYPIGQKLGPHARACHLDGDGVARACLATLEALARGCDVVVLAKFGKLEAARSGLLDAFGRAIEQGIPVLTAVAPSHAANWTSFAGGLSTMVAPDMAPIEGWWQARRRAVPA